MNDSSKTRVFVQTLRTACFTENAVRVHYFCHPLYGKEVEVFSQYKCSGETFYLISLFDNSRVFLPAWMADADVCQSCVVQAAPVCSLKALRDLRALLDSLAK
jgi:hypothetical protein